KTKHQRKAPTSHSLGLFTPKKNQTIKFQSFVNLEIKWSFSLLNIYSLCEMIDCSIIFQFKEVILLCFSSLKFGSITIIHEPLPNRVLLPHLVSDRIDRDAFSFRQEEDDKQGHNKNPG
ncbi:hypothetical protein KSS87_014731, partial [Heliosperma pusillum]